MRRIGLAWLWAMAGCCVATLALAFPDAPPAAVTGGFGEDGCHACHFEFDVNSGGGRLQVEGWPANFEPGAQYPLRLQLQHPGMATAGFQLAIRDEAGVQAGAFHLIDRAEGRIEVQPHAGVAYVQHSEAAPSTPEDTSGWALTWQAPQEIRPVVLHISAVAGDGDGSQVGDHVYALALTSEPRSTARSRGAYGGQAKRSH